MRDVPKTTVMVMVAAQYNNIALTVTAIMVSFVLLKVFLSIQGIALSLSNVCYAYQYHTYGISPNKSSRSYAKHW